MNLITTPCIFVTSGGRTATRFISELLAVAIKNCFSIQEPDVWRLDSLIDFNKNQGMWTQKIRDFGFLNMTVGKLIPMGSPRGLSLARQRNRITINQAAEALYQIRRKFVARQNCRIYVESNLQLAGLIDVIPKVFPVSRTLFMIGDGRDWVRSWFNSYFVPYGWRDPFYYLKSGRANAEMFSQDPFKKGWKRFSHFQKICWLWRFHIEYALKTIENNPGAKVLRYEELFSVRNFDDAVRILLDDLTVFPSGFKAEYQYRGELAGLKFHESRQSRFPKWNHWNPEQIREFQKICGDLMTQQNYGNEPQWQEMSSKAMVT